MRQRDDGGSKDPQAGGSSGSGSRPVAFAVASSIMVKPRTQEEDAISFLSDSENYDGPLDYSEFSSASHLSSNSVSRNKKPAPAGSVNGKSITLSDSAGPHHSESAGQSFNSVPEHDDTSSMEDISRRPSLQERALGKVALSNASSSRAPSPEVVDAQALVHGSTAEKALRDAAAAAQMAAASSSTPLPAEDAGGTELAAPGRGSSQAAPRQAGKAGGRTVTANAKGAGQEAAPSADGPLAWLFAMACCQAANGVAATDAAVARDGPRSATAAESEERIPDVEVRSALPPGCRRGARP